MYGVSLESLDISLSSAFVVRVSDMHSSYVLVPSNRHPRLPLPKVFTM